MKKWIVPFASLVLVIGLVYQTGPFRLLSRGEPEQATVKPIPAVFGKMDEDEKKEEEDTHWIQILKWLQQEMNGWLKSLNERIESEDVTRLEVRFLEILRSFLEWVKGKVDAKIESSKGAKEGTTSFLETPWRPFPLYVKG